MNNIPPFPSKKKTLHPPLTLETPEGKITIPVVDQEEINRLSEEEPEAQMVLCIPVGDETEPLIPGSTKETCHLCKQAVWMSPMTKVSTQHLPPNAMKIICPTCLTKELGQ